MVTRTYARFIPGEEVVDATQWDFNALGAPVLTKAQQAEAEADRLRREDDIRAEAYALGHAEGIAAGEALAQRRFDEHWRQLGEQSARQLTGLVGALEQRLHALEQAAAQSVLQMACDMARHVIRAELRQHPDHLIGVIREALGLLAAETAPRRVFIHPDDWDRLRAALEGEQSQPGLSFHPDPALQPGDCQVECGGTLIDGTLQGRWRQAVTRLDIPVGSVRDGAPASAGVVAQSPAVAGPGTVLPHTEGEADGV